MTNVSLTQSKNEYIKPSKYHIHIPAKFNSHSVSIIQTEYNIGYLLPLLSFHKYMIDGFTLGNLVIYQYSI